MLSASNVPDGSNNSCTKENLLVKFVQVNQNKFFISIVQRNYIGKSILYFSRTASDEEKRSFDPSKKSISKLWPALFSINPKT